MEMQIKGKAQHFFQTFFLPLEESSYRWLGWIWIALLYLGGIALWSSFFQLGSFPANFHDWSDLVVPRLLFLKDALTRGLLPLHISDATALGGVTDRYLSVPNTLISPQIILLKFMGVGQFILTNQLLMYSLAFLGLLSIRRKYSLSPLAFTILFLLFNFNGHIIAHLSVGHLAWEAYFFLPWFVLLVARLLEGDHSWSWVAKTSGLMLAIFLQGAFHQYLWLLIFLGLVAIVSHQSLLTVLKAGVFSGLISLFRLLPAGLVAHDLSNTYQFMGGYPTLTDIWQSLTSIQLPGFYLNPPAVTAPIGLWEFDLYVGLVGAFFILFFGVYTWLRNHKEGQKYYELALPMVIMVILSLGNVFKVFHDSPIPLFGGERVSSRMISVPFVFLVTLAVIEFQRWLDRSRFTPAAGAAQLGLLAVGSHDLWQHFALWRVGATAAAFKAAPVSAEAWYVANHADVPYLQILAASLAISALALVVLLGLVWREKRRSEPLPAPREKTNPWVLGRRSVSGLPRRTPVAIDRSWAGRRVLVPVREAWNGPPSLSRPRSHRRRSEPPQ